MQVLNPTVGAPGLVSGIGFLMSVASGHRVAFSTAAVAQPGPVRAGYAAAKGGGPVADGPPPPHRFKASASALCLGSRLLPATAVLSRGPRFSYFSISHPLCIPVSSGELAYFMCCSWTSDEKANLREDKKNGKKKKRESIGYG